MLLFILRRIGQGVISLLILSMVIFGLVRLSGDAAVLMLSEQATQQELDGLRRMMGLDRPISEQYVRYMSKVVTGDLDVSSYTKRPVIDSLAERIPSTLSLLCLAAIITIVMAIPIGMLAGALPGGGFDRIALVMSSLGQAIPTFFVGLLLIQVFAVYFRILPSGGDQSAASYIMPSFCIAFFWSAGIIRVLRTAMIDAMAAEYVRFARIKGLSETRIRLTYGLRNSLLPVVSLGGMYIAAGITSTIVVEAVFGWPGMGSLVQMSLANRDFPTVQGIVLATALIVIVANIVTDIIYAILDPRVRLR